MELNQQIEIGLQLERDGNDQGAIAHFLALQQEYPNHALVEFELGGAYDSAGFEAEAISHYRRALELGLPDELQPQVAVQLGSSLRNVGEYGEAVKILQEAVDRYPNFRALRPFLALALHSAGQTQAGLVVLLDTLIETPNALERYHRSLKYYADELRK